MNVEETTALQQAGDRKFIGVQKVVPTTTTSPNDDEEQQQGRRRRRQQQEQVEQHYRYHHHPTSSGNYGSTTFVPPSSTYYDDDDAIVDLDDCNDVVDEEEAIVTNISEGSVSQRRGTPKVRTTVIPTIGRSKCRRILWALFGIVGGIIVGVSVTYLLRIPMISKHSPSSSTPLAILDDMVIYHNNKVNESTVPFLKKTDQGRIKRPFTPFFDTVLPWTETEDGIMVGALEFCSDGNLTYSYGLVGKCVPGQQAPLIRIRPEQRYRLTLVNTAHVDTNLHTHGLHVSGVGTVDDVTRNVEPGRCLVYEYYLLDDASVGTFWYHPHRHPLVSREVYGGAYGMLIVDEVDHTLQNHYPPHLVNFLRHNEVLLQLASFRDQDNKDIRTNRVNGREHLDLTLERDVHYYVRISAVVNIESVNYVEFTPSDACHSIRPVAYDGVYRSTVPHPYSSHIHMMTVSSRLDLAVQCSEDVDIHFHQGTMTAESHLVTIRMASPMHGTEDGIVVSTTPTTTQFSNYSVTVSPIQPSSPYWELYGGNPLISASGPFQSSSLFWKPRRPYYYPDLRAPGTDVDEIWTVSMDDYLMNGTKAVSVNQAMWDPQIPVRTYHLNQLVEWRVVLSDTHPFHTHINHMQIVEPGGCGYRYEEGEYFDTITASTGDECRVRIQFFDFAGRFVIHCHRLSHEDKGMMTWIDIVGGPGHGILGTPSVNCSALGVQ